MWFKAMRLEISWRVNLIRKEDGSLKQAIFRNLEEAGQPVRQQCPRSRKLWEAGSDPWDTLPGVERRGGQDRTTEFAAVRLAVTLIRLLLWSSENKSLSGPSQEEMEEVGRVGTDTFFWNLLLQKGAEKWGHSRREMQGQERTNFLLARSYYSMSLLLRGMTWWRTGIPAE